MNIRTISRRSAILSALLLIAACARPVQIGSESGPAFAVEVRNTLGEDMIVSYDDGGGAHILGTVRAGGSERFIIAAPARQSVAITARNNAGTRTVGPYNVQLSAGDTQVVSLR